jgi:Tetratricopeptide repeat
VARFFERAIELDPSFAAAHSALSYALGVQATLFSPQSGRQTLFSRVVEHARRAIALDATDALGRCSLSYVLLFTGRHNEAMAEADLAVSLDPNSAQAYHCQGGARAFGGRPREAVAPLETAIRLSPSDPFTPFCLHTLGRAYYYGGDYPAAVATGPSILGWLDLREMPQPTMVAFPRIKAVRRLACRTLALVAFDCRQDRGRDAHGDLVLHCKNIRQVAVVALRPQMPASRCLDQLHRDPHPIADLAHTAFEDIAHAEVAADLPYVDRLALVGEGRIASDDEQPARFRQQGDDVFANAAGEIFLLRVAAHIGEGQHRNRWLVGERQRRRSRLR